LNETVNKKACEDIGKIIEALAGYPSAERLLVKVHISVVE